MNDPSFKNKGYTPPWKEPYIIGIAGCSGSGKTTIASTVIGKLNVPWTVLLSMDNFYKPLTTEERKLAFESRYDFDAPEAIDIDLLYEVLRDLKAGKKVQIPIYSFVNHNRTDKWLTVYGANVIILEGIYALYDERILQMMDMTIFVDTDFDICLARRLSRDITYRGRDLTLSIQQWERYVKPNFETNISPCSRKADVLLPRGIDNVVGINILVNRIQRQLFNQSQKHMSDFLALDKAKFEKLDHEHKHENVVILKQTPQLRGIHTILRNIRTSSHDFIFYFDRMATIMINEALNVVPGIQCTITTPTGANMDTLKVEFDRVASVTMIRGGECFQKALRDAIPNIRIGKLLIMSDTHTGEPQLHTLQFPPLDANDTVLLIDMELSSGAAATMAVAVLVDHGVPESRIVFVCYSTTKIALARLLRAFPNITIIAGCVVDRTAKKGYLDTLYYGS